MFEPLHQPLPISGWEPCSRLELLRVLVQDDEAANLALLLSGDLLRLVAISVLIACPIAAYTMHKWLENFSYRTPLSWWIFPVSALLAAFAALVTVGFQSVKAARTNPIVSLRSE